MTSYLSWVSVIVGCISAPSVGTTNNSYLRPPLWKEIPVVSSLSDAYPPLWKDCPDKLSDYKIENGKYIINFWHYLERQGAYKILLNETAKYFEKFAPENEQNILWGLPIYHGWQYHTDLNFYLSAMPFLAAVDSGIMGIPSDNVTLLPPYKDQMSFCFNVSSCHSSFPEAMKKWNEFYQHLKSNSSSFDDLLKYLWAAHVSSLEVAHKNFHNRLRYYSKQEADFGRNWALFVDYLAPSLFPTTLIRIYEFQKVLPTRVLLSGDRPLFISDFTGFQKSVLLALNLLHIVHKYTGTLSFIVWKTFMKSEIARELFLEILEFILHYFN
ncbi:protein LEG1 homolog isoform X3 [Myotis myotis]|uniref:protein LEG1 homolog isoform X3 n=1 Tax=Myotis myotis TaxID=51298 RepID=UPI001749D8A6|nr:protein LEG1 homolog isoform X3 [Myotis myotis]